MSVGELGVAGLRYLVRVGVEGGVLWAVLMLGWILSLVFGLFCYIELHVKFYFVFYTYPVL